MREMQNLKTYGVIPIRHSVLEECMHEYKSPKDKISALEKEKSIIRLKNGLYVVSKNISEQNLSLELIANQLYGPSYVSFETALSYHGVIPERVYITKSATLKRAKQYTTPVGTFEYIKVPEKYYAIGQQQVIVNNSYAFLIAKPEKALCDLILATSGLRIQSVKAMRQYLFDDMRIDIDNSNNWNIEIIKECSQYGYKKNELTFLYKVFENE
jgi:hypothetical protein